LDRRRLRAAVASAVNFPVLVEVCFLESLKKKRIAIVGANGVPASYGGWDQIVEHFTLLELENYEFVVYCTKHTNPNDRSIHNNALVRSLPLDANGWQSIPYDIYSLYLAWRECDFVIMLGTSGAIAIPLFSALGQKHILNIDGAEWKRGKWNGLIKAFLWLSEYVGVKFADKVVTDSEALSEYVRKKYSLSPITIAYGGDHVKKVDGRRALSEAGLEAGKYAFKVCRIVPENNIDLILEAFSKSSAQFVLVGNFDSSEYGRAIKQKYQLVKNILLLNPIYDQNALDSIRSNAGLYIHGHSVGGTNPSLVEAMCLGLNVAAFDVDYNRATTNDLAHYYGDVNTLLEIIDEFEQGGLQDRGNKLLEYASQNYTWHEVMQRYIKAVESLDQQKD